MFAVVVTLTLKPGHMEAFLPLMHDNARASKTTEPGCHQFDVATDSARPDEVFLYELYENAAAFDAHLNAPHFLHFASATDEMISAKIVKTYERVAQ